MADVLAPERRWWMANGLLRLVFGLVASIGGCLAASGNGLPPILYFFIGFLLIPLAAVILERKLPRRPLIGGLLVYLFGGGVCCWLAYSSAHPPAIDVFDDIFGVPPPAGVSMLRTRKQWFDGPMSLAMFRADQRSFEILTAQGKLPVENAGFFPSASAGDRKSTWERSVGLWGDIAYQFWPYQKQLNAIQVYRRMGNGIDTASTIVVRDPSTDEVWAVRLSP